MFLDGWRDGGGRDGCIGRCVASHLLLPTDVVCGQRQQALGEEGPGGSFEQARSREKTHDRVLFDHFPARFDNLGA